MPRIQDYTPSGNDFRTSNAGIGAFDTMGRRVAGQYDAAASDMAQAGRVTAAAQLMIGRWPFNIIKLQNSAYKVQAPSRVGGQPGGGGGGVVVRPSSGGGITDSQFAPERFPDMAALNQLSEGMGQLGRGFHRGAGSIYDPDGNNEIMRSGRSINGPGSGRDESRGGFGTTADRDGYSARELAMRDRQAQLDEAMHQKRWDTYEKNLAGYNKDILDNAQKATPYGTYQNGSDYPGTEFGDAITDPKAITRAAGYPNIGATPGGGDYGGSAGWLSGWWSTGSSGAVPDVSTPPSLGSSNWSEVTGNNGNDFSGTW